MTILNHDYIKTHITKNNGKEDVKYRWSHGATDKHLGDGMLIYSLIYYHKFQTCVCLGSGGGFIPRIMTQVKMDLYKEGFHQDKSDWEGFGNTILVDAVNGVNGEPDWTKEDSFLRSNFRIEFLKNTTEKAYYEYFVKRDIKIDFLYIDADHTFDGVKLDFDLYSKIMNKGGIITIHDTDKDYTDNFIEVEGHQDYDLSGPSEFIKTIDKRKFEVMNFFNYGIEKDFPSSSGLTIVRKKWKEIMTI